MQQLQSASLLILSTFQADKEHQEKMPTLSIVNFEIKKYLEWEEEEEEEEDCLIFVLDYILIPNLFILN